MGKFPGFDGPINRKVWSEVVQIPDRIYSLDGKRFIVVNLDEMTVPSDDRGDRPMRLNRKLASFSPMTRSAASFVLLESLNGKRKSSTVTRWLNELSLFSRTVSEAIYRQPIKVITLKMYLWYVKQKNASQEKLLRSTLLRWIEEGAPGLHPELVTHLGVTAPRKPRGMIEVQNAVPSERPMTIAQVHRVLDDVDELYRSGQFNPQEHLLWRLMISEALRPAQMRLMQFGDIDVVRDKEGRLEAVRLKVALVKQSGTPARDFMRWHRMSSVLSQAIVDHMDFVASLCGGEPPKAGAVFCVRKGPDGEARPVTRTSLDLQQQVVRTRKLIASLNDEFESVDFFNRRFKHTKLTHLAAAGASLEVLAFAGYQTSTVSLARYVNLTEEAFAGFEEKLAPAHQVIADAFRGKVIDRSEATHQDPEHRIAEPSMADDVGACGAEPCEVLACLGCYGCHRFEAFLDGPHDRVEAMLLAEQESARTAGMPMETVHLRDKTLAEVRHVLRIVRSRNA